MEKFSYRFARRLRREFTALLLKTRDRFASTYCDSTIQGEGLQQLFSFVDRRFIERLANEFPDFPELVSRQAEHSIMHRFDLLGSGPVIVKHGMRCRGLHGFIHSMGTEVPRDQFGEWLATRINRSNRSASFNIWKLIDEEYEPIDWQIDFKSGYRWSEDIWYGDIGFGDLPGVDVKVPWELGRMQHLPTLALASCFAAFGYGGFESPKKYANEFRNQVLDFIAANPPRFGVNWACAMDVAIRVTNWLVAYDLIAACGVRLGNDFDALFAASVRSHARHVAANLEWSPRVRGNHYIADIVGLMFASAYLPRDDESDRWLSFSFWEMIAEVEYQFHEDGSNFEGSVCYHRLSAEMVTWATALIKSLPSEKRKAIKIQSLTLEKAPPPTTAWQQTAGAIRPDQGHELFPSWYWKRLAGMALFTDAITKVDGMVVQFGDNDSGRFMTLGSGEQMRADNDPSLPAWSLDHRGLIASIQAVVGRELGVTNALSDPMARLIAGLRGNVSGAELGWGGIQRMAVQDRRGNDEAAWLDLMRRYQEASPASRYTTSFKTESTGILKDIQFAAFTGMGVYVVRSPRLYLAVRCGEIGLVGLGGHAHCDQLAIELVMDGDVKARDPGTYIYTPLPDRRNEYRSSMAHHVPRVPGREPADLARGVFDLRDCGEGTCLYFGPRGFIGCHSGYGVPVYRIIELLQDGIAVHDFSEHGTPVEDPTPLPLPYSQGYGLTVTD